MGIADDHIHIRHAEPFDHFRNGTDLVLGIEARIIEDHAIVRLRKERHGAESVGIRQHEAGLVFAASAVRTLDHGQIARTAQIDRVPVTRVGIAVEQYARSSLQEMPSSQGKTMY